MITGDDMAPSCRRLPRIIRFGVVFIFISVPVLLILFLTKGGRQARPDVTHNQAVGSDRRSPYVTSISESERVIDGVKTKFYTLVDFPSKRNKAIVFIHGGGWVFGSTGERYSNQFCKALVHETDSIVISIEYRLVPKYVYPVPMLDCFNVVKHILTHAAAYGIDPYRVALAGEDVGGNLAAAVALRLRDFKVQPQPKLQVLLHPCLQATDFDGPSYQRYANAEVLPRRLMIAFWAQYAFGKTAHIEAMSANRHTSPQVKRETSQHQLNPASILKDHPHIHYHRPRADFGSDKVWKRIASVFTDPYFAPLMAESVRDLPETLIVTAETDVLRDDGVWYARYLRNSAVPVTHRHFDGGLHDLILHPDTRAGRLAQDALFAWLNHKL